MHLQLANGSRTIKTSNTLRRATSISEARGSKTREFIRIRIFPKLDLLASPGNFNRSERATRLRKYGRANTSGRNHRLARLQNVRLRSRAEPTQPNTPDRGFGRSQLPSPICQIESCERKQASSSRCELLVAVRVIGSRDGMARLIRAYATSCGHDNGVDRRFTTGFPGRMGGIARRCHEPAPFRYVGSASANAVATTRLIWGRRGQDAVYAVFVGWCSTS